MSNSKEWTDRRRRTAWLLAAAGVAMGAVGLVLQTMRPGSPFDPRVVTGVGILLVGLAVAYRVAAAGRLSVEERDERNVTIRRLAGNKAFGVSSGLTLALLIWVSFSANGQLPTLSSDALWYALAATFVAPMLVYLGAILATQRSM